MSQQSQDSRSVLTTAEASGKYGLSKVYLQYLVRTKRVEGTKPWGHEWMLYEDSLKAFLAQPRSKGKKGPRGPRRTRQKQNERVMLSSGEASTLSGYSQDYLLRLLRTGVLAGEKASDGRSWLIYEDSLLSYMEMRRHERRQPQSQELPLLPPNASTSSGDQQR